MMWLVLPVGVGLVWGLLMGATRRLHAGHVLGVLLMMSFYELRYLTENGVSPGARDEESNDF